MEQTRGILNKDLHVLQGKTKMTKFIFEGWIHPKDGGDDYPIHGSIMAINKEWHRKNKMPKNPTFEQRMGWHFEHQKNCSCRPIPKKLAEEMKKASK